MHARTHLIQEVEDLARPPDVLAEELLPPPSEGGLG
jgi:hypothetical protein